MDEEVETMDQEEKEDNLENKRWCGTVSKALLKSKTMASVWPLELSTLEKS